MSSLPPENRTRVLIVDDDEDLRRGVARYLTLAGYESAEAGDAAEAVRQWEASPPDAIVLDLGLPDGSGADLLDRSRERSPSTPVVMLTGNASVEAAVDAIKRGAENFLTKPVDLAALLVVIERAIARRDQRIRALSGASPQGLPNPFHGQSSAIRRIEQEARRLLTTDRPVLLLGETGSGKGVVARWLHAHSPRSKEAFVDLNCAGLSRDLLESELFGHEAGAFTGAAKRKIGLLEEAHKGTVFLDELAEMDPTVQAKLLKALEEKRIRRLGSTRDLVVDFRLIAATHRDLRTLAAEGKFREDLYFRLSTFPLQVPALRERLEDLPELAKALLSSFAVELGRPSLRFSEGAFQALQERPWRGNIRELRNVIERAALYSDGDSIEDHLLRGADLRPPAGGSGPEDSLTLEELERRHVIRVMRAEKNKVAAAARRLGVARSSLYEKLRRFGLNVPEGEVSPEER